jgi:hypothetical protein
MTDLVHDPEFPFVTCPPDEGEPLAKFRDSGTARSYAIPRGLVVIDTTPPPTPQEQFDALELGAKFTPVNPTSATLTYIKVANNAFTALTAWDLNSTYFSDSDLGFQRASLHRPESIHFNIQEV